MELRSYEPRSDAAAAFDLWERSLGRSWPIAQPDFAAVVCHGLVAVCADRIVGLAALAHDGKAASVQLLLVDPDLRRRGIGRRLIDGCLAALAPRAVTAVRLGGTPGPYLWPGVPADLAEARGLFERWGWSFGETCWDLTRSLDDYQTPAEVTSRGRVTCRWATGGDSEPLAEFERSRFPHWADHFASAEALANTIVAVDADAIVGSLLATDHPRTPHLAAPARRDQRHDRRRRRRRGSARARCRQQHGRLRLRAAQQPRRRQLPDRLDRPALVLRPTGIPPLAAIRTRLANALRL